MTDMIQVCRDFYCARVFITDTRLDDIRARSAFLREVHFPSSFLNSCVTVCHGSDSCLAQLCHGTLGVWGTSSCVVAHWVYGAPQGPPFV